MTKSVCCTSNIASGRPLIDSAYSLQLPAKRVLLTMLADLNNRPESQKNDPVFIISAAGYRELFNVDKADSQKQLHAAIQQLHNSNVIFQQEGEFQIQEVKWLYSVEHTNARTVNAAHRLTVHPKVMPLLRDLGRGFAKFNIGEINKLQSVNQIRLYEDLILHRSTFDKSWTTTIDDIAKRYLMTKSLISRPANFKRKFLDNAVTSINQNTPYNISYVLDGRKIKFFVTENA